MKKLSIILGLLSVLGFAASSYAQPDLKLEWIRDIGSTRSFESVLSTVIDTKGDVVVLAYAWEGETVSDIFKVQKYTTEGRLVWQKKLIGNYERGMLPGGLCVDSNDNIFFLLNNFNKSFYFDSVLIPTPNWESTIFKLSPVGDLVWKKEVDRLFYGWAMEDNTELLAIDRNNDLIFTGRSQASDSAFEIDGVAYIDTPAVGKFFVAKFSNDGDVRWVKAMDQAESYFSSGDYIAIDEINNIYILGKYVTSFRYHETVLTSEGPMDMFLAKVYPTGELAWVNRVGSLSDKADWPCGIAIDVEGNPYIQGAVYQDVTVSGWSGVSTGSSSPEMFVCKFDTLGRVLWNTRVPGLDYRRLGTTIDDCPMEMVYSPHDNSIVCRSHLFKSVTLDSTVLAVTSADGTPAFWAYSPDGKLKWSRLVRPDKGYLQFNSLSVNNQGDIITSGYGGKYWEYDPLPQSITLEDTAFSTAGSNDGILAKFSLKKPAHAASGRELLSLTHVYPNPFSDRTTIEFSDVPPSPSTVQIYNGLGIKVMELPLIDKQVNITRQGMPGGIYQYQLVANGSILARGEFIVE